MLYLAVNSLICMCWQFIYWLQFLDEIHRQPTPFSLSGVSLPAPESVVDSFPLKCHKMASAADGVTNSEQ